MIENEKDLFELFKKKLIEEYGYDEKDIVFEPRGITLNGQNYVPDIIVYKNGNPFIIIELKQRYIHREFERLYNKLFEYAKFLNASYFAVASLEFIDTFKIENNKFISVDSIPLNNKKDVINNSINFLDDSIVIHLFGQIRDILKGGGKRDDYTVLTEINKLLFIKWISEKEKYKIDIKDEANCNLLLNNANIKYNIFNEDVIFNLNKDELIKVVKILKSINLLNNDRIDYIYFESFIKISRNEILLSNDLLKFFKSLNFENNDLLIPNSNFGQLSLSFDKITHIENNKIKFQTNSLLQLLKNVEQKSYLEDFLNKDVFRNNRYKNILTLPPIGLKTDIHQDYEIDYKRKFKDYTLLYIEKSLQLLAEEGYLYVILPNSILSNQTYSEARTFIKHHFKLVSIISLPIESLINIDVACSLLILQKVEKAADYMVLLDELNPETINLITNHFRENFDESKYIDSNKLQDRWDYHYFKNEFLELEYKIKNLEYIYLEDKIKMIRGSSLGNDNKGTVNLITVSSIEDGEIKNNKLSKVTEDKSYENNRGIVYENDIVITAVGKFPRCAKITKDLEGSNTNSGIIILRSKNKNYEFIEYIYNYFNSPIGQMLLHRGITYTATVPILTQAEIGKIPIVLNYQYKDILDEIEYIDTLPLFTYNHNDKNDSIQADNCKDEIIKRLQEQRNQLEEEYELKINEEKNAYLKEFELNSEALISLIGIKGEVFGVNVIRCFISIEDLKKFKIDKQDFQRDIYDEHKEDLKKYIEKSNYKFFPEIVLGINNYTCEDDNNCLQKNNFLSEEPITGNSSLVKLSFFKEEVFNQIEILDGRHRIISLQESAGVDVNTMLSVVFILFEDKQSEELLDKIIFYNLNKKARQLNPIDYLHLLKSDDKSDRLKELEILNVALYKYLSSVKDNLYKSKSIDEYAQLKECIILADYMERIYIKDKEYLKVDRRKKKFVKIFYYINEYILKDYMYNLSLVNKFYKLVVYIMYTEKSRIKIYKYILKEIVGFIEWLKLSRLLDNINEIDDFRDFYNTFQKINIPKSRKIYLSMPYHKETEWTYFIVKDIINEISNNLQIKIELIRTDKQTYGVHMGISETVYNEIESCDLMIADLTGDNVNVFNEVGFKMGIDKAQKLSQTQIIFLVNSKCYYEEKLENSSFTDNEYEISGKILRNKSKDVPFNLRGIKHIEFYTSHYLKAELYKELEQYFNYYKISKISK